MTGISNIKRMIAALFISATIPLFASVSRIEPQNWWIGMKSSLQLMVYGDNIGKASVISSNSDLIIDKIISGESPNYLFMDVHLKESAKPGVYPLIFKVGNKKYVYSYPIYERKPGSSKRVGFSSADMIYLIMPDRFANADPSNDSASAVTERGNREDSNGRHGGDIQGIINRLDYLRDLGVTAIWNTPLLLDNEPRMTYHGYACADYYRIDPRYGSNELFKTFVEEAHSQGIKVVMDFVPNHCGTAHWWYKDLPFANWINPKGEWAGSQHAIGALCDTHGSQFDTRDVVKRWFSNSMPDMNLDNPFVLQYFTQVAIWWIEWSGIDGFRVDTYPYIEKNRMSKLIAVVRNEYPEFNIVGECWRTQPPLVAYWQENQHVSRDGFNSHLPTVMDFPLKSCFTGKGYFTEKLMNVYESVSQDFIYNDPNQLLIFADNHDMTRIATELNGDVKELKLVMTMLATLRGIPQLYYGTEIMMEGKREKGVGDMQREDFPGGWSGDTVSYFDRDQLPSVRRELFDYTRQLFTWRKLTSTLHTGKMLHFKPTNGVYAYFRMTDKEAVMIIINGNDTPVDFSWTPYSEVTSCFGRGKTVFGDKPISVGDTLTIPGKESTLITFPIM